MSGHKPLVVLLLLGGLLVSAPHRPAAAEPVAEAGGRPAADSIGTVVGQLVREALESNLSLEQERIALRQAEAALAKARGQHLPKLDVEARYSRAEGGRTIDFPVGDLLNPAYRTLNDLTQSQQFPQVDNQEIAFLRSREQETTLQLRQPVFNPGIVYGTRARRHQRDAQDAALASVRRELVRDVKVAYYRYRTAQARVDILEAARDLVRENRRTNERLLRAAKVTKDAVYRAEVEVLRVQQQIDDARAGVDQARRYLNVLRNRPADTPIPEAETDVEAFIDQRTAALRRQLGRPLLSARSGASLADSGTSWAARRPELARLSAAVAASEAQRRAAQTAYLPTVSLAVDAGIQGETYGVTGEKPFVLGSVVLRWNLFDGFGDQREVERRRLETDRLRTRRADVKQQIGLEVQQALDRVQVAHQSLQTAAARVTAARESFRLTARRYEEGRANQVEYTDARTTLTEAELNRTVTRYDFLIRLARLTYAAGLNLDRDE
jgi:outer membrane protein TolC